MYQLQDEGQVPESQNNGELYATGEGEGAYEGEMMEGEEQAGLTVGSSADEGHTGEEALFTYAQDSGEMPISSSDITTSYAIADEGGMTQVYYLTEDGVLTTAMPDMGDGTLMLQPVEGGEGDGQLQVSLGPTVISTGLRKVLQGFLRDCISTTGISAELYKCCRNS